MVLGSAGDTRASPQRYRRVTLAPIDFEWAQMRSSACTILPKPLHPCRKPNDRGSAGSIAAVHATRLGAPNSMMLLPNGRSTAKVLQAPVDRGQSPLTTWNVAVAGPCERHSKRRGQLGKT